MQLLLLPSPELDRFSTGKSRGLNPAQDQVCVSDRGVFVATVLAGRAWGGSGTFRSNGNLLQIVEGCDGSAARADFNHLYDRNAEGQAAAFQETIRAGHFERPGKQRFVIVDQGDLSFPTNNKKGSKNLSNLGIQSLVLPMGRIKIKRPIRSLDIILRTCASVNMLTQTKKRVFKSNKEDYSLKTLKSKFITLTFKLF